MPVRRLERAVGTDGGMREADAPRRSAGALEIQQRHIHPVRDAVEQADLDAAAPPRGVARQQRFEHAGVSVHAAGDVADRDADAARPGGMAGDGCEPRLGLHQQVIGFHLGVGIALAVAGYVDGDQTRMRVAQSLRAKARPSGGARREVLDEHIGARQHGAQQGRVAPLLDVDDQTFLAPVEPDEIAREAVHRRVIAAREISLRPLKLDHPRPGVGEARGTVGRGDGLFQRDDKQPLEGRCGVGLCSGVRPHV